MKLRTPDSFPDAITQCVAVLGAPQIAHRLGLKSDSRVYKAMNDGEAGYSALSTDQALIVAAHFTEQTGEVDPITHAWLAQIKARAAGAKPDTVTVQMRLARAHHEVSEATACIIESEDEKSEGGKTRTRNEARKIAHEINDVIREMEALKRKVLSEAGVDPDQFAATPPAEIAPNQAA